MIDKGRFLRTPVLALAGLGGAGLAAAAVWLSAGSGSSTGPADFEPAGARADVVASQSPKPAPDGDKPRVAPCVTDKPVPEGAVECPTDEPADNVPAPAPSARPDDKGDTPAQTPSVRPGGKGDTPAPVPQKRSGDGQEPKPVEPTPR